MSSRGWIKDYCLCIYFITLRNASRSLKIAGGLLDIPKEYILTTIKVCYITWEEEHFFPSWALSRYKPLVLYLDM